MVKSVKTYIIGGAIWMAFIPLIIYLIPDFGSLVLGPHYLIPSAYIQIILNLPQYTLYSNNFWHDATNLPLSILISAITWLIIGGTTGAVWSKFVSNISPRNRTLLTFAFVITTQVIIAAIAFYLCPIVE